MKYLEWLNISGTWWVSIALWMLLVVVVAVFARSWRSVRSFTSEVKAELRKASWPWDPKEKGMKRYKELTDSTIIVTIAMLLLSGYVAGWDFIFNILMGWIFGAPQK
jgi:preprotein translocase subunit SecE